MSKHTPDRVLILHEGRIIAMHAPDDPCDPFAYPGDARACQESDLCRIVNSHDALLAACTETLRMLEAAHHSLGMWTDTNPRIVKARAAIASATGATK